MFIDLAGELLPVDLPRLGWYRV